MSAETCYHEFTEKGERVFALELAGPGDGKDSFREPFTVNRLIPEGDLAPLHSRANGTLCGVVGGFHPLMVEERKEMVPVVQESLGPSTNRAIRTVLILPASPFDPAPDQGSHQPELMAGETDPFERVPAGEEPAEFMQQVFGEPVGIGTASGFLHALELADQVGQTQLPHAGCMIGSISGIVVAGKDSTEGFTQGGFEDLGCPACGHLEK